MAFSACLLLFLIPFLPDEKLVRLKLHALEIGIFVLTGLVGLRLIFKPSLIKTAKNPLLFSIVIWTVVNCGLWFLSQEKALAGLEIRRVFLGLGSFAAFYFLPLNQKWMNRLFLSWAVAGALIALYSLLQFTGGVGPLLVPQMGRVIGTYGNPIFFATFLNITIILTLSLIRSRYFHRPLLVLLVIDLCALYLTETRAAWLALALVGLLYAVRFVGFKKIPLFVWAVVLVGGSFFVYKTKDVLTRDQGHLLIWRDSLKMWWDHPVSGVGLGAFHTNFPSYAGADIKEKWAQGKAIVNYAHNEYIQLLSEGGLLGFLSFMFILGAYFWRTARQENKGPPLFALQAAVLALLIQNFFSVDIRFGINTATLFILLGLSENPQNYSEGTISKTPLSIAGALLWLAFLGGVVFPKINEPYRAERVVRNTKGFFDERLLDPAKSIGSLEALATTYPNQPAVLEKLAYAYAKEMKTPNNQIRLSMANKAIETYQRILVLEPDRISSRNNLANVLYTLGRTEEAIVQWKKTVEINPAFLDVHLNLGKILYTQGKLKESARHFEHVLQLDPGNAEAQVYLKRMVE